jgi:hypothetical protein
MAKISLRRKGSKHQEITTDTEDMPSTHTKILYAIFVESSQTQSRKKADDIVGTSSLQNGNGSGGEQPEKMRERATKKRKVGGRQEYERGDPPGAKWGKERRGDKKRIEDERKRRTCKTISWSAYGTHVSSGGGTGLLHTYHRPRGARILTRHAPRTCTAAGCTPRHASTSRGRIRGTYAMCVSKEERGIGGGQRTDGTGNARQQWPKKEIERQHRHRHHIHQKAA